MPREEFLRLHFIAQMHETNLRSFGFYR
jgi:hypothetical protein